MNNRLQQFIFAALLLLPSFVMASPALEGSPLKPFLNRVLVFEEFFLSPEDVEGPGWAVLKYDSEKNVIVVQSGQADAPSVGLELSLDGSPHEFTKGFREYLIELLAPEYGLTSYPLNDDQFNEIQANVQARHNLQQGELDVLKVKTTWHFDENGKLNIIMKTKKVTGEDFSGRWMRGQPDPVYEGLIVNFRLPDKDEPQRYTVDSLPQEHKDLIHLTRSTFEVYSIPDTSKHLREENLSASGTGFFITSDGLFMTNAHVLNDAPECSHRLKCELTFSYTLKDGSRQSFTSAIKIYAVSEALDVLIAKIETDLLWIVNPKPLALNFQSIEENIFTMGHPTDYPDQLVFSFGHPTGFLHKTIMTSSYGHYGNSGGPILNRSSKDVTGIISYKVDVSENGFAPMGFTPISVIQNHFDLKGYVSGEKQKRIQQLGLKLALSLPHEVPQILMQLKAENSLLAVEAIEAALFTNRDSTNHQLMVDTIHEILNTRSKEH